MRNGCFYERRLLMIELFPGQDDMQRFVPSTPASEFHFPSGGNWEEQPQPSTRAAAVLSAAGVDLGRVAASAK